MGLTDGAANENRNLKRYAGVLDWLHRKPININLASRSWSIFRRFFLFRLFFFVFPHFVSDFGFFRNPLGSSSHLYSQHVRPNAKI
jgi:hypothetical protein